MERDEELFQACRRRIGSHLDGSFRLEALVGVGSISAVYAALAEDGAPAAIRILHPSLAKLLSVRTRFSKSPYVANRVGHAGAVRVLGDGLDQTSTPFLVMELVQGETLAARLARMGRLAVEDAISAARALLDVLGAASERGITHGMISPSSLFFATSGALRVLDFGMADVMDEAVKAGAIALAPTWLAPEVAVGGTGRANARTDVWNAGAILFAMTSGRIVHEAGTAREALLAAGTKPARSLARVAPDAPTALIKIVDRALAFEASQRFASARDMRAELEAVRASSGPRGAVFAQDGARRTAPPLDPRASQPPSHDARRSQTSMAAVDVRRSQAPDPRTSQPPSGFDPRRSQQMAAQSPRISQQPADVEARRSQPPIDARRSAPPPEMRRSQPPHVEKVEKIEGTQAEIDVLRDVLQSLEQALVARLTNGERHPDASRAVASFAHSVAAALVHAESELSFGVASFAFHVRNQTIWEPSPPLDRVPYALARAGVRALAFTKGIDEGELEELVRVLCLHPRSELAPEDDLGTRLWDASLPHVAITRSELYADGDVEARAAFEKSRAKILGLAHFDTSDQLEDCWQDRSKARGEDLLPKQQRILMGSRRSDAAQMARAEVPLADLAIELEADAADVGDRFLVAFARAYVEATAQKKAERLLLPLRGAVLGLARSRPRAAVELLAGAVRAIAAESGDERLAAGVCAEALNPESFAGLLHAKIDDLRERAGFARALGQVLRFEPGALAPVVLDAFASIEDGLVREELVAYLARAGRGFEGRIAAIAQMADIEPALAMVRLLVAMGTPRAMEAIAAGVKSAHAVVRIEALGHLEGVSGERVRGELRAILEDKDPDVRLEALRVVQEQNIRAAGPYLVLRIKSPTFDDLPVAEKRRALHALSTLMRSRAEQVSVELLKESRLVPSAQHEQTRELAAEILGELATTPEAGAALDDVAKRRWKNSEKVRAAATRALEAFTRRSTAPPPPEEQK